MFYIMSSQAYWPNANHFQHVVRDYSHPELREERARFWNKVVTAFQSIRTLLIFEESFNAILQRYEGIAW